ncbi:ATP-binding protein [Pseudoalteromonas gelatinilytica]|uniref:ATP-binding protein n=2 Tax=Pseudoalteromonas gelatinilytica TaxID=1703256 RepID=A0A3A3F1C3_9GAMM|nr:ATP-binding protein [Pseudoalteromonas profundi]
MKILFREHFHWKDRQTCPASEKNVLCLHPNNWDDYGSRSTLDATLFIEGELFLEFICKILVEGNFDTSNALKEQKHYGWDGVFPIPNLNYISVVSDIQFYSVISSKLDESEGQKVLEDLRDAGFLINVIGDDKAKLLTETSEFNSSLLRESGSNKSFEDGWKLFVENSDTGIKNFQLNLRDRQGKQLPLSFNFKTSLLPYDINVLIGPNGVGKSYCLKSLVEYWLGVESGERNKLLELKHVPFDLKPNLSRLILISYSPFEEFTIDLDGAELIDKEAYKYFGFRYKVKDRIAINRNLPATDSINSIVNALEEDAKFSSLKDWIGKFETVLGVLGNAFEFDLTAIELKAGTIKELELRRKVQVFSSPGVPAIFESRIIDKREFLIINNRNKDLVKECISRGFAVTESGIVFIKDKRIVELSSGQRLFSYIVVNVIGSIRKNSLIVIDEPELFLHPTLEIDFVSLLKKVLIAFKSKAILATHSLSVVREVPSNCVHIFREEEYGLDIIKPPFETFGGDMQRISSYVFGDKSISKPFDSWLEEQVKVIPSEQLIELLGDEINEEMIMKISRLGRNKDGR